YTIRTEKYAYSLTASGVANRWNKNQEYVIYSGNHSALSALELMAHRSSIQVNRNSKIMFIELSVSEADIKTIEIEDLAMNWKSIKAYPRLQQIGSKWYQSQESLILKVPSVLIPIENNYIINTMHPLFSERVSLLKTADFFWDKRLL